MADRRAGVALACCHVFSACFGEALASLLVEDPFLSHAAFWQAYPFLFCDCLQLCVVGTHICVTALLEIRCLCKASLTHAC
eukprot:scaffold75331_cov22-Tisochrysis_lutea.AAC.2